MPNFGGSIIPDHHGINYNSPVPLMMNDPNSSSCDKKMIKAVLNHLTKMESGINDQSSIKLCGSPSFGEGSSDSYLSEVMWNQYS